LVGAQAGVAKFYIDAAGNAVFAGSLSAATGTFAGTLSAAGGTFTGALSAASGTFTGTLSSVNGTFTGSLVAASGTFTGDITGASNIDITGSGTFNGLTSVPGSAFASVKANTSNNAKYGVYAESNASSGAGLIGVSNNTSSSQANAIYGSMSNPNSASIYGFNYGNGFGVQGQASGGTNNFGVLGGGNTGVSGGGTYGPGVKGLGLLSGYGLECINGFRWGSYTMSQPTGSSSDVLKGDGSWGAVSGSGTVTSVNGTGSVSGLSLSGTVTTSGNLTLGGTLSVTQSNLIASAPGTAYYLGGNGWNSVNPIMTAAITNSGTATVSGNNLYILGSTATGIVGAYVGTSGSGSTVTIDVRTTSPSDIRLKEEITNIDLGLAFVKQLRPVSYKLKADPKHQKGYGFIADEVDQIIATGSSLVYYEEDWKVGDEKGFKTIHYPSYIAVLTKAIQELSAKVAVLESK
jgi:hypothetical protein